MKLIIPLCLLLLFNSLPSQAQRVTYVDLLFVLNHNLGKTEEYLSKKGFDFSHIDTINSEKQLYSTLFGKRFKNYVDDLFISKTSSYGTTLDAGFSTTHKSDYLTFLTSIKQRGFVIGETSPSENGSLNVEYTKGNLTVTFSISWMKDYRIENYWITLLQKEQPIK